MRFRMSISVEDIMEQVHDYGERGTVEGDLEMVLYHLYGNHPEIYNEVAEMLTDTEMADETNQHESILQTDSYKLFQ